MSDNPTPQRLGRAVRYFTPVVLASALAVPMISSADSSNQANKNVPNGNAWGTAHNGDQGNNKGNGNGNGNDMGNGKAHGDDKPGNGPKDRGDDKPGNGHEDKNDDDKPGHGPKDKDGDGHPGHGPKDKDGDGHPGNNGGNGNNGNNGHDGHDGNGHGAPGKDGKDGKDGAPTTVPSGLTATPVVTTVPSQKAPVAACKSARRFRIHLSPRGLRSARVTLNGKAVRVTKTPSGAWAMINLRGLKPGTQVVRTRVVTKRGKVRYGVRRYKTCATVKTPFRRVTKKR